MKLVFIAGPFRGTTPLDVRRNIERARDLGLEVAQIGAMPVIPHTMTGEFDKQLVDRFWLEGTQEVLKRCDGVIMGRGWQRSSGSRAEHKLAQKLNLPIFYAESKGWQAALEGWLGAE